MIAVTILGNNSASPAHGRHPTAQIIQTSNHTFLVDCGEGTQLQMDAYKIKRSKIRHLFISHLHGDHYFGLIGLLNTMGLNRHESDIHIYSPEGLKEIIDLQLDTAHARLSFRIHYHILKTEETILSDDTITVKSFRVHHRIPCFGFVFKEIRNPRRLNIDQVVKHHVPREFYDRLQHGADYISDEGTIIPNRELTFPREQGKSYAYCADTAYADDICRHIHGVDLVYHESTYLKDQTERALERYHSTTVQAATIAKLAKVRKLIIGHYSSMYDDVEIFQEEARSIFENTEASREGTTYIA